MVLEGTWREHGVLRFILARNYNGFAVDMDFLVQVNVHFSKELSWFWREHGENMGSQCLSHAMKIKVW